MKKTTIYQLVTVPDSRLKIIATKVENINDEIKQILNNMIATMYEHNGIGLAATQVAINKRLVVMDIPDQINDCDSEDEAENLDKTLSTVYKMINPTIVEKSQSTAKYREGCLSVPGQNAEIERPESIKVQYLDENNKQCNISATGLLAICIQHEIDHLDGILYIDYLSDIKRKMLIQKAVKYEQ